MNSVTVSDIAVAEAGPAKSGGLDEAALWPGVADPAGLLREITEWLSGYGNLATRRTYAEGVGLPVTARDLAAWTHRREPAGWIEARRHYAAALDLTAPPAVPEHRPPPA